MQAPGNDESVAATSVHHRYTTGVKLQRKVGVKPILTTGLALAILVVYLPVLEPTYRFGARICTLLQH